MSPAPSPSAPLRFGVSKLPFASVTVSTYCEPVEVLTATVGETPPAPVSPFSPCMPCSPCSPWSPFSPFSPCGPCIPCGPCAPVAPVEPCGPCAPVSPLSPLSPFSPRSPLSPLKTPFAASSYSLATSAVQPAMAALSCSKRLGVGSAGIRPSRYAPRAILCATGVCVVTTVPSAPIPVTPIWMTPASVISSHGIIQAFSPSSRT